MKIGLEESYLGYFRYCVIMLVGGWSLCHLIWHALDNLPISDDQVFYAVGAIRAIRHLGSMPFFDFLDSLKDITNMERPPGASLLLAPFAFLLRYDIQLIKAASLAWYLLTFVSIYLLGKTYFNRETGLLGMVFFCFLPQMYHLEIDPEFYQMSLLPLVLVCCAHVWDQGRWNALWWLAIGLLTALGLLLKWVFAVYLIGPMLYMIWDFLSKIPKGTLPVNWMLPCKLCLMLLPVIGVFLWWYLPYWDRLVETIRMNTESMAYTPYKNGWEWSVPFYYPFQFLWYNKLFPTMCLLIGLLVSLLTYTVHDRAGSMKTHTQYRSGWNLIAGTLIAFLLFFSIRYENIPKKYMFPLLPLLSVYAVSWIPLLTRFITRRRMHNAFLLYGLFCILWINFGIPEVNALYYSPRNFYKNPKKEFLWYALPNAWVPDDNHWPYKNLAKSLHHLQGDSPQPAKLCVLPDLYYFTWFNCKYELYKTVPTVDSIPLKPREKGLENLYLADYILTSRNAINRFPYAQRKNDTQALTSVALGRYIDRAPAWLAHHFQLVDTFTLPRHYGEMQLYKRIHPYQEKDIAALCNFWASYHLDDKETWPQIAALWRYGLHEERGKRSALFSNYTRSPSRDVAWLTKKIQIHNLLPYEKLQLAQWALEQKQNNLGMHLLAQCSASPAYCNWKASLELGKHQTQNTQQAEKIFLLAWRQNRERPEPVEQLLALAQQGKEEEKKAFYEELKKETIHLLHMNRSENACRQLVRLLMDHGWVQDALPFAHRLYLVGNKEYKNNYLYHKVLKANQRKVPDYETLLLPFNHTPTTVETHTQAVQAKPSDILSFSFLNLYQGTYRLSWEQELSTKNLEIAFRLDERDLGAQIYAANEKTQKAAFLFDARDKDDLLTMKIVKGQGMLKHIMLRRIRATIPLFDENNDPTAKNKWVKQIKPAKNGGYRFTHEADHALLHFQFHSDTRAWDTIRFQHKNLQTDLATIKLNVRMGEEETQDRIFTYTIPNQEGMVNVPIPQKARTYPFLLGVSLKFEHLQPAGIREIANIEFLHADRYHK